VKCINYQTNDLAIVAGDQTQVLLNDHLLTSTKSKLLCLYFNACSLIYKFEEFVATVEDLKPDLIGIIEMWANS